MCQLHVVVVCVHILITKKHNVKKIQKTTDVANAKEKVNAGWYMVIHLLTKSKKNAVLILN